MKNFSHCLVLVHMRHIWSQFQVHRIVHSLVLVKLITVEKMKFSIKDFFCKCDQIPRKLQIWSHLMKNFWIKNFTFCAVDFVRILWELDQKFFNFVMKILYKNSISGDLKLLKAQNLDLMYNLGKFKCWDFNV